MTVTTVVKLTGALLLAFTLGVSGGGAEGGSSAGGGTRAQGAVVGAAGGTVLGPNGSKVVIPPGALITDTWINIEQSSAAAPPLPSGPDTINAQITPAHAPVTVSRG